MRRISILVALIFLFSVVDCNPFCNNWCPYTYGYSTHCCDGYNTNIGIDINTKTQFCPVLSCTTATTPKPECTSDNDCKRNELCCKSPCQNGLKVCLVFVDKDPYGSGCDVIENCNAWNLANPTPTTCDTTDTCKRSETCCSSPCTATKVCLPTSTTKIIKSRQTNNIQYIQNAGSYGYYYPSTCC